MRKLLVVAILVVINFLYLLSIKADQIEPRRIVNGTVCTEDEYQGVLALSLSQGAMCTATLIDPEVLLTAGHCVSDSYETFSIEVYYGVDVYNTGYQIATAQDIIKHPQWSGQLGPGSIDLALIHIDKQITEFEYYTLRSTNEQVGETGLIVGYGLTGGYNNDAAIKRKGEANIQGVGSEYYGGDAMLEIGNPTNICMGDSGGPFFTFENGKPVVSGVASHITDESCNSYGGGYETQVFYYREWINSVVNQWTGHDLLTGEVIEPECTINSECEDGFQCIEEECVFVPLNYSCTELFSCTSGCFRNYYECIDNVSVQSKILYNSFNQCSKNNCSNVEDLEQCIQDKCYDEYEQCYADNDCTKIVGCQNSFKPCYNNCKMNGTESSNSEYSNMQSCFKSQCDFLYSTEISFKECIYDECSTEMSTCLNIPSPGHLNCDQILFCISGCNIRDDNCYEGCFNQGTTEGRMKIDILNNCSQESCVQDLPENDYLSCLEENCTEQLVFCKGNLNIGNHSNNTNNINNQNNSYQNHNNPNNNNQQNTTSNNFQSNTGSNSSDSIGANNTNHNYDPDSVIPTSGPNQGCQCSTVDDVTSRWSSPRLAFILLTSLFCLIYFYLRKQN